MQIRFERNRTSTFIVMYSLYLYFLGLSLRNTSKALEPFKDEKRSYVSVWNWIQRFGSYPIYKRKRVTAFIIQMKLSFRQVTNISGYGQRLNLFTVLYLEFIFQMKETCLQQRISLDLLYPNMVDIQYTQRWWYMVSSSMQILTSKTLFAFTIREKHD